MNNRNIIVITLLLVSLISIVPNVNAVNYLTITENFDDETTGLAPSGTGENYVFTSTGANTFVSTQQAHASTKSLKYTGIATTNSATFDFNPYSFCTGDITFWIYLPTLPAAGDTDKYTLLGPSGLANDFIITSTGSIQVDTIGSGGTTTQAAVGVVVPTNTWIDLEVIDNTPISTACSSPTFISNVLGFSLQLNYAGAAPTALTQFVYIQTGLVGTENRPTFIDDITFNTNVVNAPIISPIATASHTGILGFDADPDFNNIILRRTDGVSTTEIRTLNPSTLTTLYNEATTCNHSNGVVALSEGSGYYRCTAANVDTFKLISSTGTDYPLDSCIEECPSPTSWSISNLDGNSIEDGFDRISSLYLVDAVDFGEGPALTSIPCEENSNGNAETRIHAFNFVISGTTGGASNVLGKMINFAPFIKEYSCNGVESEGYGHDTDLVSYSSSAVDDICSSHSITDKIMYAVDDTAASKGFTISDSYEVNEPFNSLFYDTELTNTYTAPSTYNGASDIACSGGEILLGKGTTLALIKPSSGVLLQNTVGTILSVSLSYDGKWGSYTESSNTYIFNTTNGNIVAQIVNPSGIVFETIMDYFGQRILLSTSTTVALYDIHATTTVVAIGHNNAPPSSSSSSSSNDDSSSNPVCLGCQPLPTGSKPFGIDVNWVADGLDVPVIGVQVLIGLILMVIFAIWLYKGTGSVVLAVMGAGLGLIVAVVMSLIPAWVIMAVVLFLLIVFGKMLFGGFTGGEES